MKNFKRLLAAFMAGTMIFGSTMMVFAADDDDDVDVTVDPGTNTPGIEGDGVLEAFVDTDVFKVVLPTIGAADLKFVMDPQGLMAKAAPDDYKSGAGAVYFVETDTDAPNHSKSKAIVLKNKSSFDVDTKIEFSLTVDDAITVVEDADELTDATVPSLYLAVNEVGKTEKTAITESIEVTDSLEGIEYVFDVATEAKAGYVQGTILTDKYYGYVPEADATPTEIKYELSGACDKTADWTEVSGDTKIKLIWTITKHVDGPQVTISPTGLITITGLTADQNYKALSIAGDVKTAPVTPKSTDVTYGADAWTKDAGGTLTVQLAATYPTYYAGNKVTVTITLTDDSTITASVDM